MFYFLSVMHSEYFKRVFVYFFKDNKYLSCCEIFLINNVTVKAAKFGNVFNP